MKRNLLILAAVLAAIVAVIWSNRAGDEGGTPAASGMMELQPGADGSSAADPAAPKKGSAAPAFALHTLEDEAEYRVGGSREKALIVNFWASWCGPCDVEAPDLVALHEKYGDKVDLYAVNATNFDKVRNAVEFVREKGFKFPVLKDADGKAGDAYKVFAYPTSFLVDRDGRILERIEGVIPLEKWEELLKQVI